MSEGCQLLPCRDEGQAFGSATLHTELQPLEWCISLYAAHKLTCSFQCCTACRADHRQDT